MSTYPSNGQLYSPGITRISVSGFKSLANRTDVEIRPLTILAGANSSGKSSAMQPLLLMKQTLESAFVPAGPFLLSGPHTRYTETAQFLSQVEAEPRLDLEFQLGRQVSVGFGFADDTRGSFDVSETRVSSDPQFHPWRIRRDSTSEYLRSIDPLMASVTAHKALPTLFASRFKYYFSILATSDVNSETFAFEPREISALNFQIRKMIHVQGLRGDQNRKWLLADVQAHGTFEGSFESYVPSLILKWQHEVLGLESSALDESLSLLGLASSVQARILNESEVEVHVPRTLDSDASDFVNIADVGLAVSTVLPVLVALIQADPEQLVYIEQPELHLHPKAQFLVAQLLVRAANRGVRVVIETHSSLLLRGILTEVAKGSISNDKVMLHWFERDKTTGISKVISKEPDSAGRVGDWPEDFSDVELSSDNDYLNAVEGKLFAAKK